MTEMEHAILAALRDLDSAVKAMASGGTKPDLLQLFGRIDGLAAQLPSGADPQLLHFLRKKSYDKARLWLEGRQGEVARGGCRND